MNIQNVKPGDVILEPGGGKTTVTKVELGPGSCKTKVHINGKFCYEGFTNVRVSSAPEMTNKDWKDFDNTFHSER